LALEPLTVGHADEMVDALSAPDLYEHIGGTPPDSAALTPSGAPNTTGISHLTADVAWVVGHLGPARRL